MNYISYDFNVFPPNPWSEILMARISLIEFESFEEKETGFSAYILADYDDEDFVKDQIEALDEAEIIYEKTEIQQVNWNEEWEKNFNPIDINGKCYIRAEFHEPNPTAEYDIVIQPKMSFGTGHHSTTHLMVEMILNNSFEGKSVLDMGTGTGILAILAKMRGADLVEGIDIDEWSYENSIENAERNQTPINFYLGGAESIPNRKYEVILANIQKNILIQDMPFYVNALEKNGELYLSGLFNYDFDDILAATTNYGLTFVEKKVRNEWIALKFKYE